jgi:flagellar basal body-associated protein FliL
MEENFSEIVPNREETKSPRKKASKKMLPILALFVLLIGASFALLLKDEQAPESASGEDKTASREEAGMRKFASYEEMTAFLEENADSFAAAAAMTNRC